MPTWISLINDDTELSIAPIGAIEIRQYVVTVVYTTLFGNDPEYTATTITVDCSTDSIELISFAYPNEAMWEVTAIGDTFSIDPPTYTYCGDLTFSFVVAIADGEILEQTWVT